MELSDGPKTQTRSFEVAKFLHQRWPWLAGLFMERRQVGVVEITGFRIYRDVGTWKGVLYGFRSNDLAYLVLFGTGLSLYGLLGNLTGALRADKWRVDKYRKFLP
jgi:hypothetical protein